MGPLGWIPFGGSVAGLTLFVAATTFLVGMVWRAPRLPLYLISAIGAVACVLLARNWPDRAAALAIGVSAVSRMRAGAHSEDR